MTLIGDDEVPFTLDKRLITKTVTAFLSLPVHLQAEAFTAPTQRHAVLPRLSSTTRNMRTALSAAVRAAMVTTEEHLTDMTAATTTQRMSITNEPLALIGEGGPAKVTPVEAPVRTTIMNWRRK